MNIPVYSASVIVLTFMLLLLPAAQAADLTLNDACSLADAITAANSDVAVGGCSPGNGADTVSLSGDITLAATLPHVTSEITIEGNDRFRIFAVNGGNLTVNNLVIIRGSADWGGAIVNVNNGMLTINNSNINSNWAAEGGALGNGGNSTITIVNSDLHENSANVGGAIYNIDGRLSITGGNINRNSSEGEGGAIYIESGQLSIKNNFVSDNSAEYGGAAFIKSGTLSITNSTISGNSADFGGAIYADGTLNITDSVISNNSAAWSGGAIDVSYGTTNITNSIISKNSANWGGGGAIVLSGLSKGDNTIFGTSFSSNSSNKEGGAVKNLTGLSIVNSAFTDNSAVEGGAIYNGSDLLIVVNTMFSANLASQNGGGIGLFASEYNQVLLAYATLSNNSAKYGGGLYVGSGSILNLYNSIVTSSNGQDCFGRLAYDIGNLIADGSCFATLTGDPMLGDIVEPGDGSPPYFPLLEGSPAIDAADYEYCPDTDIIGTPRPQGDGCDIGAYEYIESTSG